jgi:hypothetical protein
VRPEEVDSGHQDQPGEDSAGEHDGGDAHADDVSDAEILRSDVGADSSSTKQVLFAEVRLIVGRRWKESEEILVLKEGVEAAETEAEKDA